MSFVEKYTIEQLTALLKWPSPTPGSPESKYIMHYVSHITGVDLLSPLDQYGKVSEKSLTGLSKAHVELIAQAYNIAVASIKKVDLIQSILRVHPKVDRSNDAPIVAPKKSQKRSAASGVTELELRHAKRKCTDLEDRLLVTSARPDFAEQYSLNYGFQDRMNRLIYSTFRITKASSPQMKYAWMIIYCSVINAYGLWKEMKYAKRTLCPKSPKRGDGLASMKEFCATLVTQMADIVETMADDGRVPTLSRSSSVSR